MSRPNPVDNTATHLMRYLRARGIPAWRVETTLKRRLGARAPDRKTFTRWLKQGNLKRKDMLRLVWAVRETLGDPTIPLEELFDLDANSEAIWND